jgi:ABC-type phosphate/phosphonate transport system substrate-binding protein
MYNAGPKAAAAWRALFEQVFVDTQLDVGIIEHGFPQPIDALWAEPALLGAFMCGWPFTRSAIAMQPIAAPVPSPARYRSLPRYCSDFLARAESGWTRIEDAFGARFGWMAENSHSGFNAPRAHLARMRDGRDALFSEVHGPLGNPARAIEALRRGEVDLVALDGYYLDLVRHHDPGKLAGLVAVGSTPWTPIPLLVAAPGVAPAAVEALRTRLLSVHRDPAYAPLLSDVLLDRFEDVTPNSYSVLEDMARYASSEGYGWIR